MGYSFDLGAIRFELEFRKVKVMRLTVYPPDGEVKIFAPCGTAPEIIRKFAASKIDWVKKHREKFKSRKAEKKPAYNEPLRNHSTVFFWGEAYKLEIIERIGNSKIVIDGEIMKMYVRPGTTKAKKQEVLDRWFRRAINKAAPAIIEKREKQMGLEVKKLFIRKMKSHWGSCNCQKKTLRVNSELAKRSPEYLDYVIAHEMLHIVEKGHNRNFYRLLDKYLPEWKSIRKKLNAGEL
jgi:predicted metal-dependent hydrolase